MRRIPVDRLMLPVALESHGENQWYLDLETGGVFPIFDDPEEEEKIENAPERYLLIGIPSQRTTISASWRIL